MTPTPPSPASPGRPVPTAAPPRRRWDTQKVLVLVVLPAMLLAVIVAAGVWFAFADWSGDGGSGKAADVSVVGCGRSGGLNAADLEVEVTNRSSRPRSYAVGFEVTSGGGTRLGTGDVYVATLRPGQTARETGTAVLTDGAERYDRLTCQVTGVR